MDQDQAPLHTYTGSAMKRREGSLLTFPVSENEGGKAVKATDGRVDGSSHVTGPTGLLEDGVLRLAPEVEVCNTEGGGVAADAVPACATVDALPGAEDAEEGLAEGGPEGQEGIPFESRTAFHRGGPVQQCSCGG